MTAPIPREGMLAAVRNRRGLIATVEPYSHPVAGVQHLVTVEYLEPAPPHEERLVWELEAGTELQEGTALPRVADLPPMRPGDLDALVRAARWTALRPFTDPDGAGPLEHDALAAPFHGAIQVESYQLVPVLTALRMPRVTLLLADDVGLGKTVEAGLVLTELLLRRRVRRVLILCPASLRLQWQSEMRDKFSLPFEIVDRDRTYALRRELGAEANPWRSFPRIIASYDYLKQEDVKEQFLAVSRLQPGSPSLPWDLLIVDEAHNLAPAAFGDESDVSRMLRELTPLFEHRLFLTATPHNGHTWSFTGLLETLDPVRFARKAEPLTEPERSRVEKILIRRLKPEINAVTDPPRFTERFLRECRLALGPGELALTRAFQAFRRRLREVIRARGRAEERAGSFAVEILGKRLLSCPYAFADSWHRYKDGIEGEEEVLLEEVERARRSLGRDTADDREAQSRADLAARTVGAWLKPLEGAVAAEMEAVDRALAALGLGARDAAGALPDPAEDARFAELVKLVRANLQKEGRWLPRERFVVFTEYKTTLDYLERRLRAEFPGEGLIRVLFGGMDEAAREEIKAEFNDPETDVKILLATDAAAEGLNLQQTARYLLHYDVPWNPARLDQRNGRLDRHGQARDVTVHHFSTDQDEDLAFLSYVVRKVDNIRHDLGSMGEVFDKALERRLVEGEAAERVRLDLDAGVERSRERAAVPRQHLAEAAAEERKLAALAAEVDLDAETLRETLQVAMGALLQGPDARGRFELPAPIAPAWQEAVDDHLRRGGRGGTLQKLLFDPERLIDRENGRPLFRPSPDSTLLHLGHPFLQSALAHLARLRFQSGGPGRWTVRRGPVPEGADALVLLTVEELAVNDLRETFHHWVRTFRFPVRGGVPGEPLPHLPARELCCGGAARTEDIERARAIWEDAERPLRDFLRRRGAELTDRFRRLLEERKQQALEEERERFQQRQGEISRLIAENSIRRLEREIAELRQSYEQRQLFEEEQRLRRIEQDIAEKEAEIGRRRRHYEDLRERLAGERARILEQVLPKRHALRGEVQILPVAVEVRL